MRLEDLDFELPDELIAQEPLADREASRMMVVDRTRNSVDDSAFASFPDQLTAGDLLVLNNTKVFPARLFGRTETGANVEVFLVAELADGSWECLARPGRRLSVGKGLVFDPKLIGKVVDKLPDGRVRINFESDGPFYENVDRIGRTPLPPYIKRASDAVDTDRERYQTVFASTRGAIAAPTAGLHFTPTILDQIRSRGVEVCEVTLHVGYGTFEPVREAELSRHKVAGERYSISETTTERLNAAAADGRRIVAIGTTTTRALESNLNSFDRFTPGAHTADLTITPGYQFRAIGALLTNFHLPKSSLLILTSTFAGHELIMKAYRHAVAKRYRFYSYGDCMFIK